MSTTIMPVTVKAYSDTPPNKEVVNNVIPLMGLFSTLLTVFSIEIASLARI